MTIFINVGPPRSGTHSFRDMCSSHPQINIGKLKEPAFDFNNYLKNWNLTRFEKAVLDSTPMFEFIDMDIKTFLKSNFSVFKKIFLMIDPRKFYSSKLFHNYISIQRQKMDDNFDIEYHDGNKILDTPFNMYEAQKWLKSIDLCSSERFDKTQLVHLEQSIKVFGKDNILIVQTSEVNEFRKKIFKFLELEYYPSLRFPHSYRTVNRILYEKNINNGHRIKLMKLYNMTIDRVNNDKQLDEKIKSDFIKMNNLGVLTC